MCSELAAVVGCYRQDTFTVREQQPSHRLCRRHRLSALLELFHEDEVGGALCKREDGVPEGVDNGIHLPVAKPLAISLHRTLVDACAVGNVGRFCGT